LSVSYSYSFASIKSWQNSEIIFKLIFGVTRNPGTFQSILPACLQAIRRGGLHRQRLRRVLPNQGRCLSVRSPIHARLQRELAALRAQAKKEKQMNRRVQLNLAIKRLEAELAETIRAL